MQLARPRAPCKLPCHSLQAELPLKEDELEAQHMCNCTLQLHRSKWQGRRGSKSLQVASELRLERMIAYFDQNSSGTIGEAEFVQATCQQRGLRCLIRGFESFWAMYISNMHSIAP